ncbi:hypothetical protein M9Y10_027201 [Tritrichomonas musculus]|uniref:ABC transporter domain-containing protein n=1 Tax=Tritrichomonas musculus TaxID=1915356 RepID=A0ABR2H6L7_9EUKA
MGKLSNICPLNHLKAILLRRYITFKRSWKSIIMSMIGTLFLSALGIAVYWMMTAMNSVKTTDITFDSYDQNRKDFVIIGKNGGQFQNQIIEQLKHNYIEQTNSEPTFNYYDNLTYLQKDLYNLQEKKKLNLLIPFGLDFTKTPAEIFVLYNSTTNTEIQNKNLLKTYAFVLLEQALWQLQFNQKPASQILLDSENTKSTKDSQSNNIQFNFVSLNNGGLSFFFRALCPMFLVFGLLTIVNLIVTTSFNDIRGPIRNYMMQCTLKLFPYWLGAFIVDFCIWIILTTIVWALFNLGWIEGFHDNLFSTWWVLVFQGPSFLLFLYCFLFCFNNQESGPRQIFIILLVVNFVVVIITMMIKSQPIALNWIWSLFPSISLQQILAIMIKQTGKNKKTFSYYWKDSLAQPFMIMEWIDIIIYGVILIIIECSRRAIARAAAKRSFSSYNDYFKELKSQQKGSPETIKMEDEVHKSHDWAVRIEDVSRLFIDTAHKPVPAVNCVCLGIKDGCCFGFLGANGAGKTTLMNMITGMIPPSSGTIEIFGKKQEDITDTTVLSICPQFNTHLFNELTPNEHFKIYGWLFQKDPSEAKTIVNKLISELEMKDIQDIPIRELSGGDARKLAIALSFFGPAKLVLLDEPTAFLDPVGCRCVQEMVLTHKREKTFMLCTHILNEAEFLCDIISIMVRGNVYSVGTPQYLTQKFGTEYKIDIMLNDASEESSTKIDQFFQSKLPNAQLTIERPASRIYSIPANAIQLAELFIIMEEGKKGNNGYNYFTCSTSSLERVFMEIVRISEQKENESSEAPKSKRRSSSTRVENNEDDSVDDVASV